MAPQALLGGIAAATHGRFAGPSAAAGRNARPVRTQAALGPMPANLAGRIGVPHALSASAGSFQAGAPLVTAPFVACGGACRRDAAVTRAAKKESAPEDDEVENVVIIGSGPAGYTAAIYAARANLAPFCFEGFQKGGTPGGQLMTTTEVENFPGFPDGITGPDLMDRMRQQAVRWGSECIPEDVMDVDLSVRPFVIKGTDRTKRAHAIIVATGATAKRLGIPSEHEFWSRGISACAICDGASPIFKGQELSVVGGGDTAAEEAVYLTKYGKHVHLLVRSGAMTASKAMQDRALANDKVTVHMNTEVVDAYGDSKGRMAGLTVKDSSSGEERKIPCKGLFYGIGHTPNSEVLGEQVDLDEAGYVKVKPGTAETSVEGVYSAGDLHDIEWRQAITAAGSGCMAAISVERYLVENDLLREVKSEGEAATTAPKEDASTDTKEEAEGEEVDLSVTKHKGQTALRFLYHEAQKPMAVLYTSPTCGPCRTLKPMINSVVDEYEGAIYYVEIDIELDPEIAEAAGVMGTPTFHIFKDKGMVESHTGVKMKREFREMFDKYIDGGKGDEGAGAEVAAEETEHVPQ